MNLFDESRGKIGSRPTLVLNGINLSAAVPSPYIRLFEPNVCQVEFMAANSPTCGEYVTSQPMGIEQVSAFIQAYIDDPEGVLTSLGWKWKSEVSKPVLNERTEVIRADLNLKDFFKKKNVMVEGGGT